MKKKVLVTGGAGYIGAHTVVELENEGYEAIILDDLSKSDETLLKGLTSILGRSPIFYKGNCGDSKLLRQIFTSHGPIESVMHFAAYKSVGESVANPLMYYSNNVGALIPLLEEMMKHGVSRLIFSSSCTVYGQPDHVPVTEETPFKRAESPYGATKQMCERMLEDVFSFGMQIISLRYFNPIGAHPSGMIGELPVGLPNNLVPYITQTAARVREKLTIFGNDYSTPDGTCVRDFIHVVDLARAHTKAMEYLMNLNVKAVFEVFNLGTGEGVSVKTLVDEFAAVTGVAVPHVFGPRRSGDVERVYADPSKANRVLKWQTKFSTGDALLHAWNWEKRLRGIGH